MGAKITNTLPPPHILWTSESSEAQRDPQGRVWGERERESNELRVILGRNPKPRPTEIITEPSVTAFQALPVLLGCLEQQVRAVQPTPLHPTRLLGLSRVTQPDTPGLACQEACHRKHALLRRSQSEHMA